MYGAASPSSGAQKTRIGSRRRRAGAPWGGWRRKGGGGGGGGGGRPCPPGSETEPQDDGEEDREISGDDESGGVDEVVHGREDAHASAAQTPRRLFGFSDRRLQHNVRGVAGNNGRNGNGR